MQKGGRLWFIPGNKYEGHLSGFTDKTTEQQVGAELTDIPLAVIMEVSSHTQNARDKARNLPRGQTMKSKRVWIISSLTSRLRVGAICCDSTSSHLDETAFINQLEPKLVVFKRGFLDLQN